MLFEKDTKLNECYRLERIFDQNYTPHFWEEFLRKNAILAEMLSESCKKCSTCNKFAKFAILVQTCKVLVRNAKLARI